jgi:hypothetical protein
MAELIKLSPLVLLVLALLLMLAPLAIWVHVARCSRALRRIAVLMGDEPGRGELRPFPRRPGVLWREIDPEDPDGET